MTVYTGDPQLGTWKVIIGYCRDLPSFNRFVLPLAKGETQECKEYAARIARERGYRYNTITKQYE
jgi:hypothetical protein